MTTVEILTVDDAGDSVERRVHAPALRRETVARLMEIRREAEALGAGAEYLLEIVRVALSGTDREALAWVCVLDENLTAEREALNPVVQGHPSHDRRR